MEISRRRTPAHSPHIRTASALLGAFALVLAGLVSAPAQAAVTPTISIKASDTSVTTGESVRFTGAVSNRSVGATIHVQKRDAAGIWHKAASTKVNRSKRYAVSVKPTNGTNVFRTRVIRNAYLTKAWSKTITVRATRATAAAPTPSPSTAVSTQVSRILADTNKFRADNGKPPLKLNTAMNTVAGNYAKKMHDSCTFVHNPSYASQIPSGWSGAAENIAAGYAYTSVVQGWINSPGHRANLLGNYTDIGIGYYGGSNCYKTYYVQNFAKY